MRTSLHSYRNDLLLALRLRDVPGPRIAEVLAEVESHVSDTGEDPRETFGEPRAYAEQVAAAVGLAGRGGVRGWLLALRGKAGLVALLALLGGWLLPQGLYQLGAGTDGPGGVPSLVPVIAGSLVWLVAGLMPRRGLASTADRVLDPRSGVDMAPDAPRWANAIGLGVPAGLLVLCGVLGLLSR